MTIICSQISAKYNVWLKRNTMQTAVSCKHSTDVKTSKSVLDKLDEARFVAAFSHMPTTSKLNFVHYWHQLVCILYTAITILYIMNK